MRLNAAGLLSLPGLRATPGWGKGGGSRGLGTSQGSNGTQLDPPRQAGGGREGQEGARQQQRPWTQPRLLAWPASQDRPPTSRQVSQGASQQGGTLRAQSCPARGLPGQAGGGEAGPLRARPGAGRASPVPTPSPSLAEPPDGWGSGVETLLPSSMTPVTWLLPKTPWSAFSSSSAYHFQLVCSSVCLKSGRMACPPPRHPQNGGC